MAGNPATGKRAIAKADKEAETALSSFASVVVDAEQEELKYVATYLKGNTNLLFRLFASTKYVYLGIWRHAVQLHAVCVICTQYIMFRLSSMTKRDVLVAILDGRLKAVDIAAPSQEVVQKKFPGRYNASSIWELIPS
jgi:hypothetical protein